MHTPDLKAAAPPWVQARELSFAWPSGPSVLAALTFRIDPGLTLIRGGEGRGKSSLLKLIAGELHPTSGSITVRAGPVFQADPADPGDDPIVVREWLRTRQARFPDWDTARADTLIRDFRLDEHLAKQMLMLSTGSRRKVWLVAAFASGAPVILLDTPFAALDAPACRALSACLTQAATHRRQAVVMADHELAADLQGLVLAGLIDLGD